MVYIFRIYKSFDYCYSVDSEVRLKSVNKIFIFWPEITMRKYHLVRKYSPPYVVELRMKSNPLYFAIGKSFRAWENAFSYYRILRGRCTPDHRVILSRDMKVIMGEYCHGEE